ncbi:PP2C family serine/threonine-protein phosphatase [Peptostreptococcaceae bacterium AGR-M142]
MNIFMEFFKTYFIYIITTLILILLIYKITIIYKLKNNNIINNLKIDMIDFVGNKEFLETNNLVSHFNNNIMAVMADGHGKNFVGKKSSKVAIQTFDHLFRTYKNLNNINYFFKNAFNRANKEILKYIDDEMGGTSLSCAVVKEGYLYYAVCGNVNISIFRNDEIIPLSEGHTIDVYAKDKYYKGQLQKQVALQALKDKRLLNYLGQDGFKDIEYYDRPVKLKKDDVIVILNSGISEIIPLLKIEEILSNNFDNACYKIKKEFEKRRDYKEDNGSVILMKYKK